jgi:hypothetical protein
MMDKEKLDIWIERLNKANKKDHEKMVVAMAKENTLKIDDAWQLLKLAGFDPKAKAPEDPPNKTESKKQSVVLRHKTEYPKYRRAGLALTQKAETYEVTDEQLAMLKKDPWVVFEEDKKDGADK